MKHRVVAASLLLACGLFCLTALSQTVPGLINYQGRITDSAGMPISGETVGIRFELYPSLSGDTMLWGETHGSVQVDAGLYHVILGSVHPLTPEVFVGPETYLQVIVDGETMTPRQRITSVPYALAFDVQYLAKALEEYVRNNPDLDGDGYNGFLSGGPDCNDGDTSIHPGALDIAGDSVDQNCDGMDVTVEVCGNSVDDDGDVRVDCEDQDCKGAPECLEAGRCDDGMDNDKDSLTDCRDPDCDPDPLCIETICDDWTDNDNNGLTDCQDPDCAAWDGGTWRVTSGAAPT